MHALCFNWVQTKHEEKKKKKKNPKVKCVVIPLHTSFPSPSSTPYPKERPLKPYTNPIINIPFLFFPSLHYILPFFFFPFNNLSLSPIIAYIPHINTKFNSLLLFLNLPFWGPNLSSLFTTLLCSFNYIISHSFML